MSTSFSLGLILDGFSLAAIICLSCSAESRAFTEHLT